MVFRACSWAYQSEENWIYFFFKVIQVKSSVNVSDLAWQPWYVEMGKNHDSETVSNGLFLILFLKVWVLFARMKIKPGLAVVNPHWLQHFPCAMESERYWKGTLFPLATLHLFFAHLGRSVPSFLFTFERNVGVEACLVPSGVSWNLLSISPGCGREEAPMQRLAPSREGEQLEEVLPAISPQKNMFG